MTLWKTSNIDDDIKDNIKENHNIENVINHIHDDINAIIKSNQSESKINEQDLNKATTSKQLGISLCYLLCIINTVGCCKYDRVCYQGSTTLVYHQRLLLESRYFIAVFNNGKAS